jgi:hypothetical protein
MNKPSIILPLVLLFSLNASSQKKILDLPDIPGYVTMKCDFHLHTVFSDGNVWPTYRIDEAVRDGLDAIAITDHLEYTPKKGFVPVDHNAAWKISENYARERNIILVHGTEITRGMPPGHFNALFIKDAAAIAKDSVWDSFEAAFNQGAFIHWNHPGWKSQQPDGIPRMYDIHRKLIKNGWLHGIEFFNGQESYPLVFRFCEENNLALLGNSDAHGVISESYPGKENGHRPMTLVFAKSRTLDALREAMFSNRTLVFFNDYLVGRNELATSFFNSCISVSKPFHENEKNIFIEITNKSGIPFYLVNGEENTPASVTLAPKAITRVVLSKKASTPLVYDVRNILTGEDKVLRVTLKY